MPSGSWPKSSSTICFPVPLRFALAITLAFVSTQNILPSDTSSASPSSKPAGSDCSVCMLLPSKAARSMPVPSGRNALK